MASPKPKYFTSGRPSSKPRSRKDMIDYLDNHFRYPTFSNGWGGSTSYAQEVKLYCVQFPDPETRDAAFEWIWREHNEEVFYPLRGVLRQFAERYHYGWQIDFNGRSGGYLVLQDGGRRVTGHKSRCTCCGQLSFKKVLRVEEHFPAETSEAKLLEFFLRNPTLSLEKYPEHPEVRSLGFFSSEIRPLVQSFRHKGLSVTSQGNYTLDARCGRCGAQGRVNLTAPLYEVYITGKSTDQDEDFEGWKTDRLRDRVDLIWDFDQTVEQAVAAFVETVQQIGPPWDESDEDEGGGASDELLSVAV